MKSYAHLASKLFARPLLLHRPVIQNFGSVLAGRMAAGDVIIHRAENWMGEEDDEKPEKESRVVAPFAARGSPRVQNLVEQYGDIAIIHIEGVIDKALTAFELDCYGGIDLRDVDQAIALAAADPSITRVVFEMNTPGGSTTGVPETAARIAALAETKEVHAYTDSMCCSAGMWLASQVDHMVATASSIVGSIGVYIALVDESEALKMEGYKVELIKAGNLKAMGASFKPLSDEERSLLQADVNRTYDAFRTAVTTKRSVPQSAMEGQWYDGTQALIYNAVDEVTSLSFDEYIAALLSR